MRLPVLQGSFCDVKPRDQPIRGYSVDQGVPAEGEPFDRPPHHSSRRIPDYRALEWWCSSQAFETPRYTEGLAAMTHTP